MNLILFKLSKAQKNMKLIFCKFEKKHD
eukprot:UN11545